MNQSGDKKVRQQGKRIKVEEGRKTDIDKEALAGGSVG